MRYSRIFIRYIPPGILTISLLGVYLMTLAPGITWANYGSDGGDLITAAATGGVAHPTGYPTYLLFARIFQLLPIGSLAFRTNLMSALATVIAALIVYDLTIRFLPSSNENQNWLAGLASAYAFGLSPMLWSQAVITEVYALHILFVSLILYLSIDGFLLGFAQKRLDGQLGLTFGLALGNHLTIILLLPILLPSTIFHKSRLTCTICSTEKKEPRINSLLQRLFWLGIGLLIYLSLPLRALSRPPINWGYPVKWEGLRWLVSGTLYQDQLFVLTFPSILSRVQTAARLLIEQFGVLGLVLGLTGLVAFYGSSRLYANTIWTALAFFFFAIIYGTGDSFLYLIPAFLCFAIWIGLGLGEIMNVLKPKFHQFATLGSFIFIFYLITQAATHWSQVDASQDLRAERFGEEVFAQAPINAIVFAKGDKAVFAMWYFHYALHKRPDLVVIAVDLLHFDWYQKTLYTTYPDLIIPGRFPFAGMVAAANPDRPVCNIHYDIKSEIYCSEVTIPSPKTR